MRHASRAALAAFVLVAASAPLLANEPATREGAPSQAPPAVADASPLQTAVAGRLTRMPAWGGPRERAERQALQAFYASRANAPVWTAEGGLTARALEVLTELAKADDWGLSAAQIGVKEVQELVGGSEPSQLADAEVGLSLAVLAYARHARGGRIEPVAVSEHIDRKPPLKDAKAVLEEITAAPDAAHYLRGLNPRHPEFERLRQLASSLKAALATPAPETAAPSQGRRPKRAAERPEAAQLRKVLASMEQWRWMPEDLGRLHVTVNIPEFTMRVVKEGRVIHSERVIVGKTETPTPVFSNAMQTVVFQPNWYVPPSIKEDELLPALESGSNILARRGLKVQRGGKDVDASRIDWGSVDPRQYVIYQPSGPNNALGQVKFLFPNRHDVYMHDTPSKGLFNSTVRTFSHGCVRVRNPLKLAELVMREDKAWDAGQIDALVKSGPQNNPVALERRIPVHITYFTATVDAEGKPAYSGDIYGHDSRITAALRGQALVAENRGKKPQTAEAQARPRGTAQAVARPAPHQFQGRPARQADRNWARNALNNPF